MTNDRPHMTLENGEKLYEGEYGITRVGARVGPFQFDDHEYYPWIASEEEYTEKGEYYRNSTTGNDIIAREAPASLPSAEPAISLDTLENLTTPLGLLDYATRKALEAHGGPYEYFHSRWQATKFLEADGFAHRVKKQPKVETVKRAVQNGNFFIGYIAIDKINGEYDLTTVRPWVEGDQ